MRASEKMRARQSFVAKENQNDRPGSICFQFSQTDRPPARTLSFIHLSRSKYSNRVAPIIWPTDILLPSCKPAHWSSGQWGRSLEDWPEVGGGQKIMLTIVSDFSLYWRQTGVASLKSFQTLGLLDTEFHSLGCTFAADPLNHLA